MKNFFVSLSLLLAVAASSASAREVSLPDPGVEEVFKKEFAGAENVTWSRQDGFQKASFVLAGHRVIAFFDENNELAGCARDIFYDQLPLLVMKAIDKKFPGADMLEVREITNSSGTSYLLRAEVNNKKYKLKISSEGNMTAIEKLSK